jgi:hypothetical protein
MVVRVSRVIKVRRVTKVIRVIQVISVIRVSVGDWAKTKQKLHRYSPVRSDFYTCCTV